MYIYIYMCVCVCIAIQFGSISSLARARRATSAG